MTILKALELLLSNPQLVETECNVPDKHGDTVDIGPEFLVAIASCTECLQHVEDLDQLVSAVSVGLAMYN